MKINNDLLLIVRINEDIKKVVKLARRINILALNAILLSRRAGNVARGFAVISDELRGFSKELTQTMNKLTELSYEAVQVVSQHQRYRRINRFIVQTGDYVDSSLLKKQLASSNARVAVLENTLRESYQRLQMILNDADEGGRFGSVISRSLKIEATYGGSFSQMLSQIALEFGDYIDSIPSVLNQLKIYLQR